MLLKAVIGSLVLTSFSAADWAVEITYCEEEPDGPPCDSHVAYVPNQSFAAFIQSPFQEDSIYLIELRLSMTSQTPLKIRSAGSATLSNPDCDFLFEGWHEITPMIYFWYSGECATSGTDCLREQEIIFEPGEYQIQLYNSSFFSIENTVTRTNTPPGDYDGNGILDVEDYNAIGSSLGLCATDANRDYVVNYTDLLAIISDWGTTCE